MRARPSPSHPFFSITERRPLVIAHRGGAGLRPENTLEAFRHAAMLGADVLEMDVRHTSDDHLVIIHDEIVDRTTNGSGAVSSYTLDALRRLDAGFKWSADSGQAFPFRAQNIIVPTVEEVFREFPNKQIVIEIKQGEPVGVAGKLCKLIHDYQRADATLVASVNHTSLTEFRRSCTDVATSASADEARNFLALSYTSLTSAYSPQYYALQIPPTLGGVQIVTKNFVAAAHSRNLLVHAWTINDPDEMERMLEMGVDGIITDRPDIMLDLLRH